MKIQPMRVTRQRSDSDCGVACLSMILDKDYGDIICVVRDLYPEGLRHGLGIVHLEAIAARFQKRFRRVYRSREYLMDRPTGILAVLGGVIDKAGHWVVLKDGVVIEPWHEKRPIYGLAEYLQMNKCRTATLLILED